MKKYILLGLSAMVLVACGNEQTKTATESATASIQSSSEPQKDKNDVGNELLEEVGQYNTKSGAKSTLVAIAKTEEENSISEDIFVKNATIKVMKVDNIEEGYADMFSTMGIGEGDHMLQVTFDMKNDTPYTLSSISTPTIVTSAGEQITFSTILGDYEILSGATVYGSGALAKINNSEINGVTIHWDIYQDDANYSSLETQPIEVLF